MILGFFLGHTVAAAGRRAEKIRQTILAHNLHIERATTTHHDIIAQATADRQAAIRLAGEEILALQAFKL